MILPTNRLRPIKLVDFITVIEIVFTYKNFPFSATYWAYRKVMPAQIYR
jgi:hypothetical protein